MNAQAALLNRWRKVLVFSISADDSWSFSQLPDARQFPLRFPIAPDQTSSQHSDREEQEYAGYSLAMICLLYTSTEKRDTFTRLPGHPIEGAQRRSAESWWRFQKGEATMNCVTMHNAF